MKSIPSLEQQQKELFLTITGARAANHLIKKIELPTDLYNFILANMPEGYTLPAGIAENSLLLPGCPFIDIHVPVEHSIILPPGITRN